MSKAMGSLEKRLRVFTLLFFMYITTLIGCFILLIPYLPMLLIDRAIFHKAFDYSMRLWFGLAVFLLERVGKIKIYMHQNKKDIDDKFNNGSIILMNHRTRLDWMFYFCILYRQRKLEDIKIILKRGLEKIPGAGWAMQTALFIFIYRKWEIDRQTFSDFINYFCQVGKKPWLLIFPEGTDMCNKAKARSDQYANENNLEIYNYVLHPRVTGFAHVYNEMKRSGILDSVQDVAVGYKGEGKCIPHTELDFLTGTLPEEIHFYIDKFGLEEVLPLSSSGSDDGSNKEALASWLNIRWKRKEALLKSFYEDGQESEKFKGLFEQEYVTVPPNGPCTDLLVIYPAFWLILCTASIYLFHQFFFYKLYILFGFAFFVKFQFFGKRDLQEFVMNQKIRNFKLSEK